MENSSEFDNLTSLPSPSYEAPRTPAEYMQRYAPAALAVDRIISPIWYALGLVGNPIAVRVWLCRRMRKNNSSAVYVGTLAMVHTLFLVVHFTMELQTAWGLSTYNQPVSCESLNVMRMMLQYYAPLLVMAFTTERYIAVNHPFQKEKFCTMRRAIHVTVGLGLFSLALSMMQAYVWNYDPKSRLCLNVFYNENSKFETIWTLVSETLIFFVVPVCVLVFNILVIIEIRKLTCSGPMVAFYNQGVTGISSPTSTVTLLSASFYLICTLLPASVVYSLQAFLPKGDEALKNFDQTRQIYVTYQTVRSIVEEICLSNYACYFLIYYITGQYFRKEVKKLFGCSKACWKRPRRDSTTSPSKRSEYTTVSSNGKTGCEFNSTQM